MASSRISRILVAAAVAVVSMAAATADVARRVVSYVSDFAVNAVHAFKVDPPFQPGPAPEAKQSLGLVAAKAFMLRVAGRGRPTVTPRWRMCPSA